MAANDLELQLLCFSLSTFPINMFQVETLTPHTFGGPWDPFNDKGCKLSYRMVPLKASGRVWKPSCDRLVCFKLFVLVLTSCQLQTLITNPSWLLRTQAPYSGKYCNKSYQIVPLKPSGMIWRPSYGGLCVLDSRWSACSLFVTWFWSQHVLFWSSYFTDGKSDHSCLGDKLHVIAHSTYTVITFH